MRRTALYRALAGCFLMAAAIAWTPAAMAQEAAPAASQDNAAAPSEADSSAEKAERREQLLRRSNSYHGPVGGIHVIEAGSGAPGSFRLQVITDFFYKKDYLYNDDQTRYVGGAVSLGFTPIEHLELSLGASARSVRNSVATDEYLSTIGDPYFDVKGYGEVAPGVTLGGDVLLNLLTKPDGDGVAYAGTSVGLRANLSLDLRRMPADIPLELRFNGGYYIDESGKIVEDLESDRLARLVAGGVATDTSGRNEAAHLARREERLAYAVNRVDHASLALGLEAPLKLSKKVALHPIFEWELWLPVNRQDFDCAVLTLPNGNKVPGHDSCLAREGLDTWPQRITAGARLFPALGGFSLLAAIELGVGGTTNFVRELAPTPPYRVYAAAAYTVDYTDREPVTIVKEVEKRVEVPVEPKTGRIRGRVVEQGAETPVADARVSFPRRDLSPLLTDNEGAFVSYALRPGNIWMEVAAEGYRASSCNVQIPPEGGDVETRCVLEALPRMGSVAGRVLDAEGNPVTGAQLMITGPVAKNPVPDESGQFRAEELPPGDYQLRTDHPDFLVSLGWFHVDARKQTALEVRLAPKPKKPQVSVQKRRLALKSTVLFATNTAELDPRSEPLVAEIADILLRTPEIQKIEIRGHTDAVGTPDYNMELSQQRADAIKDRLQRAGVEPQRLEARGFGATKPVAPNISERNRARNRRVEFAIIERSEP